MLSTVMIFLKAIKKFFWDYVFSHFWPRFTDATDPPKFRLLLILLFFSATIYMLPRMIDQEMLSATHYPLLEMIHNVGLIASLPFWGHFTIRVGVKKVMVLQQTLFCVFLLVKGICLFFGFVLFSQVAQAFLGIAVGAILPCMQAAFGEFDPDIIYRATGLMCGLMAVAFLVGTPAAYIFANLFVGPWGYLFGAGLSIVLLQMVGNTFKEPSMRTEVKHLRLIKFCWTSPFLFLLALRAGCAMVLDEYIYNYVVAEEQQTTEGYGINVFFYFMAHMCVACIWGGKMMDWLNKRQNRYTISNGRYFVSVVSLLCAVFCWRVHFAYYYRGMNVEDENVNLLEHSLTGENLTRMKINSAEDDDDDVIIGHSGIWLVIFFCFFQPFSLFIAPNLISEVLFSILGGNMSAVEDAFANYRKKNTASRFSNASSNSSTAVGHHYNDFLTPRKGGMKRVREGDEDEDQASDMMTEQLAVKYSVIFVSYFYYWSLFFALIMQKAVKVFPFLHSLISQHTNDAFVEEVIVNMNVADIVRNLFCGFEFFELSAEADLVKSGEAEAQLRGGVKAVAKERMRKLNASAFDCYMLWILVLGTHFLLGVYYYVVSESNKAGVQEGLVSPEMSSDGESNVIIGESPTNANNKSTLAVFEKQLKNTRKGLISLIKTNRPWAMKILNVMTVSAGLLDYWRDVEAREELTGKIGEARDFILASEAIMIFPKNEYGAIDYEQHVLRNPDSLSEEEQATIGLVASSSTNVIISNASTFFSAKSSDKVVRSRANSGNNNPNDSIRVTREFEQNEQSASLKMTDFAL